MKPALPESLLDPDAVSSAEAIGLAARFVVEGFLSGEHRSPFHGFSIEFTQHREYVPGDDIRHLDWKVLGKSDRYVIKQYEQETNYVAQIILDASESMTYGSGKTTKLHYAKLMAACLSYVILQQRDASALAVCDTAVRTYLPRSSSLGSIHNIMATLAEIKATEQTDLGRVLHDLAGQVKRRGIFIIISDLLEDEEKLLKGIQHLRFGGHEVIVFHVLDPAEIDFDFSGSVEFQGLEGGPQLTTRPRDIRKSYLAAFNEFLDRVRIGCERQNCHYMLVNTAHPLKETMRNYLGFRHRATAR